MSQESGHIERDRLYHKEVESIRLMFNNIAREYDKLNGIMSLGLDKRWRKECVQKASERSPKAILDLATGTGDLAFALKEANQNASVVGLDLTEGMLEVAQYKAAEMGYTLKEVSFVCGNALNLPFKDHSFDAVTIAFGIRNFHDISRGLSEIFRVLRPGGRVCILELAEPSKRIVKPFYRIYTQCFIPLAGKTIAHDKQAYQYLPDSIKTVPMRESMCRLISDAGFQNASYHSFTPGVCVLYVGDK
ncbi:MAG: bifunctional demethylmenaquinone methyltransferase/2-methoxy-6-polyprenyl-1,4-benzoquinol methylase UbiE [Porphyromonas sp.]|nr:bifunctional demethylmenaquinone methyltransferase/2-methoxy-6-polyprenyl-1,4-benzoquinol methylase UbiE [Porphyromonas sp.]